MTDTVARSDELDKKLEQVPDIDKAVSDLITSGAQNRRLIRWVITSIVFEVVLTFAIGFVFVQTQFARANTISNKNALIASCNSGNEFRKSNLVLWQYILDIPPETPRTQQQTDKTAKFQEFLDKTFALRDCTRISNDGS